MNKLLDILNQNILIILLSFIESIIFNKIIIYIFNVNKIFQPVKLEGPKLHYNKNKIPTMGGLSIILCIILNSLIFTDIFNINIKYILIICILYSFIGFIDDFLKVTKYKNFSRGLYPKYKLILQYIAYNIIYINFLYKKKNFFIFLFKIKNKWYIYLFNYIYYFLVINGCSNSVNLMDGLDGLVSFQLILLFILLNIISFVKLFNKYSIYIIYINNICSIIIGSILGFLWYNSYPSEIFMGDIGSLSLGSILGLLFCILNCEIILIISGLLLIVESVSVLLQIITYRFFNKKRIFLMAPIHHHFELKNIKETKIIIKFFIIEIILFIISIFILNKYKNILIIY